MDGGLLWLLTFLTIPRWFMAIWYIMGALCIWNIKVMPPLVRVSLIIPLLTLSAMYAIAEYIIFDPMLQSVFIRIGNFIFVLDLIVNFFVYRYGHKRKLL
jgi:hypothetical protein